MAASLTALTQICLSFIELVEAGDIDSEHTLCVTQSPVQQPDAEHFALLSHARCATVWCTKVKSTSDRLRIHIVNKTYLGNLAQWAQQGLYEPPLIMLFLILAFIYRLTTNGIIAYHMMSIIQTCAQGAVAWHLGFTSDIKYMEWYGVPLWESIGNFIGRFLIISRKRDPVKTVDFK